MNVNAFTRYGEKGASSRVRFLQFFPYLQKSFNLRLQCLLNDDYINTIYSKRKVKLFFLIKAYLRRLWFLIVSDKTSVFWIQKELFPFFPFWFEKIFLKRKKIVVDYDDATFHTYDCHRNKFVRLFLGRKIDKIMCISHTVVVGNSYLAKRAFDAGAKNVVIIPSVIDLKKYSMKEYSTLVSKPFVIGWIGSPGSQKLLESLLPVLAEFASTKDVILRVVGARNINYPGLRIENLPWSSDTEVNLIKSFDVGIMPVQDEPFQRGKCGFKLIQYMACGIPVIASPIGFNNDIVKDGVNGFLASNRDEWLEKLEVLMRDAELRKRLGSNGRRLVEKEYCIQVTREKIKDILFN